MVEYPKGGGGKIIDRIAIIQKSFKVVSNLWACIGIW